MNPVKEYIEAKIAWTECQNQHFRRLCNMCGQYPRCEIYTRYTDAWIKLQQVELYDKQDLAKAHQQGLRDGEAIRDKLSEKLRKIRNWTQAYPLEVFPKPDLEKAAKVLKENGMTLDSISADAMRHVLEGIRSIINE